MGRFLICMWPAFLQCSAIHIVYNIPEPAITLHNPPLSSQLFTTASDPYSSTSLHTPPYPSTPLKANHLLLPLTISPQPI